MEDKTCQNCRYDDSPRGDWPCDVCSRAYAGLRDCWEPAITTSDGTLTFEDDNG